MKKLKKSCTVRRYLMGQISHQTFKAKCELVNRMQAVEVPLRTDLEATPGRPRVGTLRNWALATSNLVMLLFSMSMG